MGTFWFYKIKKAGNQTEETGFVWVCPSNNPRKIYGDDIERFTYLLPDVLQHI